MTDYSSARARVTTIVLLLAAFTTACRAPARVPPDLSTRPPEVVVAAPDTAGESVVVRTNVERRKLGLPELGRSKQLIHAAQLQANQMAAALTMSHELPRARYRTMNDRLAAVGYSYHAAGENIAECYASAASVVAGWMTSPGHRANIVSRRYSEMGGAVATGKNGRRFWAQVFGSPR